MVEGLIVIGIIGFVAAWAYASGKSTGSRKGFHVGRSRGRRRRRR